MSDGPLHEHGLGPTGPGSVLLEIGDGAGALVVHAPPDTVRAEIEIRRAGCDWTGLHTAVRERRVRQQVFYAGLFASLEAGQYEIRWRDRCDARRASAQRVVVKPGEVTEAKLASPIVSRVLTSSTAEIGRTS